MPRRVLLSAMERGDDLLHRLHVPHRPLCDWLDIAYGCERETWKANRIPDTRSNRLVARIFSKEALDARTT